MDAIAVHPSTTEPWQQGWVRVEDPPLELSQHRRPEALHVARQQHHVRAGGEQHVPNSAVQCLRLRVRQRLTDGQFECRRDAPGPGRQIGCCC